MENKIGRFMRNTGAARFFIPLGIVLIVLGIILLGVNTDSYVETTGKVASVTACPRGEGEEQLYDVEVAYTVDGKAYTSLLGGMNGTYAVGDEFKLFYDPADPEKTTNSKSGLLPIIMIGLGALALVFGVYKTVTSFKKSKALDAAVPGGGKFPEFGDFKNAPGVKEYYCRFDGKALKPGYILEDADRTVLFEGKMTKQALIGARTFEFVNHAAGTTAEHEVGHTVTQTFNDELFSANSSFKFDGRNVWDVVHEAGIRLATDMHSKFPNCIYNAAKNGEPFARIETTGMYVHEDDAAQHAVNIPTGKMYYRVWTASDDFDTLFLTVFAISETEQAVVE